MDEIKELGEKLAGHEKKKEKQDAEVHNMVVRQKEKNNTKREEIMMLREWVQDQQNGDEYKMSGKHKIKTAAQKRRGEPMLSAQHAEVAEMQKKTWYWTAKGGAEGGEP